METICISVNKNDSLPMVSDVRLLPVYTLEGLSRTPHCRTLSIYTQTGKLDWSPVGTLKELVSLTVNFTPELDFSAFSGAGHGGHQLFSPAESGAEE
jgi:hypothetical protein